MRIDQNGNVGIGIASPLVPLHVKGAISGDYLYINPQNSAIGEGGEITLM